MPNCGLLHTAWHTSSSFCSVQQANIASTSRLHDGKKAGLSGLNPPKQLANFGSLPNFTQVTGAQFTETAEHSHGENYQVVKCRVPIYSVIGSCKVLTCNKKFLFKVWEKEKSEDYTEILNRGTVFQWIIYTSVHLTESPLSLETWQRKHLVLCLFTHTLALFNLPNTLLRSQQHFPRNAILALLKQILKNSFFPTFLSKLDLLMYLHTQSLMLIFFFAQQKF